MSEKITLFDLGPSPNNLKVRLALKYKNLDFEKIAVNPMDRASLVEATGQPLTPAMKHGDTVVYDSAAILRYLDANFEGPRLFAADVEGFRTIAKWENYASSDASSPIGMAFGQFFAEQKDPAVLDQANTMLREVGDHLEEKLKDQDWLTGDTMTAADICVASWVHCAMISEEDCKGSNIAKYFHDELTLGDGREKVKGWVNRVMAYDC